jgi:NADPH-dependent ferric siderophore reductase
MVQMMGNAAAIAAVDVVSPQLRLVRFRDDAPRKRAWLPGQEIEFLVNERAFRHYTLMACNPEAHETEVLFYLKGKGPGSTWIETLEQGQQVLVLGPGERVNLPAEQAWYMLLGDETSIGAMAALRGMLPASARVLGAVEVEPESQSGVAALVPGLAVVPHVNKAPGEALVQWLQESEALSGQGAAYLSRHAQSIQPLRAILTKERGMDRRFIK